LRLAAAPLTQLLLFLLDVKFDIVTLFDIKPIENLRLLVKRGVVRRVDLLGVGGSSGGG
jgi:hypothetical protein